MFLFNCSPRVSFWGVWWYLKQIQNKFTIQCTIFIPNYRTHIILKCMIGNRKRIRNQMYCITYTYVFWIQNSNHWHRNTKDTYNIICTVWCTVCEGDTKLVQYSTTRTVSACHTVVKTVSFSGDDDHHMNHWQLLYSRNKHYNHEHYE